jgi:Zn ribbon nucleic-acid-binding protein
MRCPFCHSQDIRSYTDRENNLDWYLCRECRYQGYDARLFSEGIDTNIVWRSEANRDDRVTTKNV